jgi:hypothetical protein
MSYDMHAKLVPYSSMTGQSIALTDLATLIADKINK